MMDIEHFLFLIKRKESELNMSHDIVSSSWYEEDEQCHKVDLTCRCGYLYRMRAYKEYSFDKYEITCLERPGADNCFYSKEDHLVADIIE